ISMAAGSVTLRATAGAVVADIIYLLRSDYKKVPCFVLCAWLFAISYKVRSSKYKARLYITEIFLKRQALVSSPRSIPGGPPPRRLCETLRTAVIPDGP